MSGFWWRRRRMDELVEPSRRLVLACGRTLDGWAEADDVRRHDLWRQMHEAADDLRDVLEARGDLP